MRPHALLVLAAACGGPVQPAPPMMMPPVEPPPVARADGTLDAWATERALPTPRANHCAAAFGNKLLVAGGNYRPVGSTDFAKLDDLQVATVDREGALLPWRQTGTLPGRVSECLLAVSGHTVLLLGGLFDDETQNANVWKATLADDGTPGPWTVVGQLPYGRRALSGGAALQGDTLYLSDAKLESEGSPQAVLARATLGETLGAWTMTPYAMEFRGKPMAAFTPEAAFIIGGYGAANAVLGEVVALGLPEGAAVPTTALPEGRAFGAAAASDGWLFATGGRTQLFGAAPLTTVYSAPATGTAVGGWKAQLPLPEARSNHTATVVGDFLFVVGGGNTGPGLDTVFRTRVKRLPAQQ